MRRIHIFLFLIFIISCSVYFLNKPGRRITPAPLTKLTGHKHEVVCLDFSPDGKLLASSSLGGETVVWDLASNHEVFRRTHNSDNVCAIRFHPKDNTVYTACTDGFVRVWEFASQRREPVKVYQAPIRYDGAFSSLVIDPTGIRMVTDNGSYQATILWNLKDGTFDEFPAESPVQDVALAPSGKRLAVSHISETVTIWDIRDAKTVGGFRTGGCQTRICYSPDKKYIATGSRRGVVRIWNAANFAKVAEPPKHRDVVEGLQFTPDGAYLLSCCGFAPENTELRIWDVAARKEVAWFVPDDMGCMALAISPNGQLLATASFEGEIRLWDLPTILAEAKK